MSHTLQTPENIDSPQPRSILVEEFGRVSVLAASKSIEADYWKYMATHDALTGLSNRQAIVDEIDQRRELDAKGRPFGVILLDMDQFKAINDTIGHNEGDRVLGDFGIYLATHFLRDGEKVSHERQYETADESEPKTHIGRIGGDEFTLVVDLNGSSYTKENQRKPVTIDEKLTQSIEYIRKILDDFVNLQPEEIQKLKFNFSIGGAAWTIENKKEAKALLKEADEQMYKDKRARKQSR